MKKQVTLLSGLLLMSSAFAQVTKTLPVTSMAPSRIAEYDGKESHANFGTQKADGDFVWGDDFSAPGNWTIGTSGQGTFIIGLTSNAGYTTQGQYSGVMASTTVANGFAFFNGIQYLTPTPMAAPQNTWVQSMPFDYTGIGSISLSFQQRYRAFNTDVTYVEFSEDGGTTWSVSQVVNAAQATNATAVQNTVTIDIPVNGTATGVVRFRWENTSTTAQFGSGYGWAIDDIVVNEGYGNNLQLLFTHSSVGSQELQYTQFPVGQVSAGLKVAFDSELKNTGYNTQNAKLHVTSGAYNFTGPGTSIAAFTEDTAAIVTADGFPIPSTVGVNNFNFEVVSDSALVLTSDDSGIAPFQVTNYIQAVDRFDGTAGSISGNFGAFSSQGAGEATGIGTYFEVFENGQIGAFQVGIGNSTTPANWAGQELYVVMLKYNGTDFVYETETDPYVLQTTDFGKLVNFVLPNTIAVTQGDVFIAIAVSYIAADAQGNILGGIPIAFSGTSTSGATVGLTGIDYANDLTGLASDPATPTIVRVPVVRVDYHSVLGVNEIENATEVSVSPNPFNNEANINFNLKSDASVSVKVTDLAGRVVMTIPATQMNAGTQSISIDGSAFKAGVYNYTLSVDNNVITKRIVKQ